MRSNLAWSTTRRKLSRSNAVKMRAGNLLACNWRCKRLVSSERRSRSRMFTCGAPPGLFGADFLLMEVASLDGIGLQVFGDPLEAVGADAVTEADVGVFGNVMFDLVPVILVVANLFAISANREQAMELFDVGQRILEFSEAVGQIHL